MKGDENYKILLKFQGQDNKIDIFDKKILDLTDQDENSTSTISKQYDLKDVIFFKK